MHLSFKKSQSSSATLLKSIIRFTHGTNCIWHLWYFYGDRWIILASI